MLALDRLRGFAFHKQCSVFVGDKIGFARKLSGTAQVGRQQIAKIPYVGAVSEKLIHVSPIAFGASICKSAKACMILCTHAAMPVIPVF